jgi:addiction module HigA family antidote
MRKFQPVTPGGLLVEEFLKALGIGQYHPATGISVPAQRIGQTGKGERVITANNGLHLFCFFGLSNGYWLRAQASYDTETAERTLREIIIRFLP